MDKCENCGKHGQNMIDIKNYVVKYHSWEAYNCCCEECALQKAVVELGIAPIDVDEIE